MHINDWKESKLIQMILMDFQELISSTTIFVSFFSCQLVKTFFLPFWSNSDNVLWQFIRRIHQYTLYNFQSHVSGNDIDIISNRHTLLTEPFLVNSDFNIHNILLNKIKFTAYTNLFHTCWARGMELVEPPVRIIGLLSSSGSSMI